MKSSKNKVSIIGSKIQSPPLEELKYFVGLNNYYSL